MTQYWRGFASGTLLFIAAFAAHTLMREKQPEGTVRVVNKSGKEIVMIVETLDYTGQQHILQAGDDIIGNGTTIDMKLASGEAKEGTADICKEGQQCPPTLQSTGGKPPIEITGTGWKK